MRFWRNVNRFGRISEKETMRARGHRYAPRISDPDDVVVAAERKTLSGHSIGIVTLNSVPTLNALSMDMIDLLMPIIMDWRDREDVVAVVFQGAGDRAFCAGGDILALHEAMKNNRAAGEKVVGYPATFFCREYRLDYMMRDFNKPIVTLGDGIVMGGGLGLFSASEFRVVTERTRLAMPEISIGLFPDAGGTWIMHGLSVPEAQFLCMTGAPLNAGDCLKTRLGTHAIPAARIDTVVDALADMKYVSEDRNSRRIERRLKRLKATRIPASKLRRHRRVLRKHLARLKPSVQELVSSIRAMEGHSEWIDKGIASMNKGCPTSLGIVHEQLARCRTLTMADAFRMELIVAINCAAQADFQEGIRAALIDKDNSPVWHYSSVEELPDYYIRDHFRPPWSANPLHDIEDCRTLPLAFTDSEEVKKKARDKQKQDRKEKKKSDRFKRASRVR